MATKLPEELRPDFLRETPTDEELREITGIDRSQEREMEHRARSVEQDPEAEDSSPETGESAASPTVDNETVDEEREDLGLEPEATLYHPDKGQKTSKKKSKLSQVKSKAARRVAIAGATALMFTMGGVFLFIALIPLKINSFVNNLEDRFFSTSRQAIGNRLETHFEWYVREQWIPSLTPCSRVKVSKDCTPAINGQSSFGRMARGWRDSRIEDKLKARYGISIELNPTDLANGRPGYTLMIHGQEAGGFDRDFRFSKLKSGEIRENIMSAVGAETKWQRMFARIKYGGILQRKYKLKLCVTACKIQGVKEKYADWKTNKKFAFKSWVAQRVIQPFSDNNQVIIKCFLNGGCDGDKGAQFREANKEVLSKLASSIEQDGVDKLLDRANKIAERGFARYTVEEIMGKVFGEEVAGKAATRTFTIFGILDTMNSFFQKINRGLEAVKVWVFVRNSQAAVAMAQVFITHRDEIKTGTVDSEVVGQATDLLSKGMSCGNNVLPNEQSGQCEDMTKSRLYSRYFTQPSQTAFLPFQGLSYADSSVDQTPIKCKDGVLPSDQEICPEAKLTLDDKRVTNAKSILDGFGVVLNPYNEVINRLELLSIVNSFAGLLLKYTGLQAILEQATKPVAEKATDYVQNMADDLIPYALNDKSSGRVVAETAMAGFDVGGNDSCREAVSCVRVPDEVAYQIQEEELAKSKDTFNKRPLFARLFSTDTQYSAVSRLALSTPSSSTNVAIQARAMAMAPINLVKNFDFGAIFGIFGAGRSQADTSKDPFGVPQYAIPAGTMVQSLKVDADGRTIEGQYELKPIFEANPDTYTDEYCAKFTAEWEKTVDINENTGEKEYAYVNPCILEQATAASAAGLFTTDVLSDEDKSGVQVGGSTSIGGDGADDTSPGEPSSITEYKDLTRDQLIQQIKASSNWKPQDQAVVNRDFANPDVRSGGVADDLLRLLLAMVQKSGSVVAVSSLNSDHPNCSEGSNITSNHKSGLAADIGNEEVAPQLVPWLFNNREALGINELIFNPVPSGTSTLKNGVAYSYPAPTLADHRNHIHVSVKGPKVFLGCPNDPK